MGQIYTLSYSGTITTAGGDVDYFEIAPAANRPVRLLGFSLGQTSEVGDAAEEGLRISIIRLPATFTSGSGGSSVTPRPLDVNTAASGATCEANNATVATTNGTAITLAEMAWNIRGSPFEWWAPSADMAPRVENGSGLVIRQQTTLADDMSGCFTAWFEEV